MRGNDKDDTCPTCFGTGKYPEMKPVRFGHPIEPQRDCPDCRSTGRLTPKPTKPRGAPIIEDHSSALRPARLLENKSRRAQARRLCTGREL